MGKGDEMRKRTYDLLAKEPGFIGNVEGCDLTLGRADVVVTDGFTGNVALKTLEGAMRFVTGKVLEALATTGDAADVLLPALAPLAQELDPDTHGGAVLLGVDGVCIISHGSSSARAIVNAVRVGRDAVDADLVGKLRQATAG
jgi:glycerol-3-phosphate acyltransferase PlsX